MQRLRHTLFTAIMVMIAFITVTYTACKKGDCVDMVCLNGGICDHGKCSCPTGYQGSRCEEIIVNVSTPPTTQIDPCKNIFCKNGGVCKSGICQCPTGYYGTYCEKALNSIFFGTFNGNETCTSGEEKYALTFTPTSPASPTTMLLSNLYNDNYTANCNMLNATDFSFSGSSTNGTEYTGTGSLNNNVLTVNYTIMNGSTSNTCTFIGSR